MFVKIRKCNFLSVMLIIQFTLLHISCREKSNTIIDNSTISVVKTVKVENRKLNDDLNSFGIISYKTKNNISVLVEGTLEKIYIREGDYVHKGQTLANLKMFN